LSESEEDIPSEVPQLKGHVPLRTIHRKLLPRRPGRDAGLEQYCTMYAPGTTTDSLPTVLILTPILVSGSSLPYYHPAVSHLAFRYIQACPPRLQIEVVPLPGTATDVSSRLYRTALALLDTLHRYGYGAVINYKKRVMHDRLVPREIYQDMYLLLRERHSHLVDEWHESTDPLKHVFEVSQYFK
jgi:tRNASer (uridine44-2'-O)-methyltransferase